ncbi:hypothetical protein ABG088_05995 [Hydrogenibacillus schlegelii]|nr:hypothetical protein [Hydrogenibacillus schlegelii]
MDVLSPFGVSRKQEPGCFRPVERLSLRSEEADGAEEQQPAAVAPSGEQALEPEVGILGIAKGVPKSAAGLMNARMHKRHSRNQSLPILSPLEIGVPVFGQDLDGKVIKGKRRRLRRRHPPKGGAISGRKGIIPDMPCQPFDVPLKRAAHGSTSSFLG